MPQGIVWLGFWKEEGVFVSVDQKVRVGNALSSQVKEMAAGSVRVGVRRVVTSSQAPRSEERWDLRDGGGESISTSPSFGGGGGHGPSFQESGVTVFAW